MQKSNLLSSLKTSLVKNARVLKWRTAIKKSAPTPLGIRDGDRHRFWTNYNAELVRRISIIKSQQE